MAFFVFGNQEMSLGAYNFGGRGAVVRCYGPAQKSGDFDVTIAHQLLFERGEINVKCNLHVCNSPSGVWAERVFPSKIEALGFVCRQAIRYGLTKAWTAK